MLDPYFNPIRNVVLPDAEKQPDRSLAIVLAAVVDDHLRDAIQGRLVANKKAFDRLFADMGPLATFSARIDLGLLLALYRDDFARALHAVRKIRNMFAHEMHPLTLESEEIKKLTVPFAFIDAHLQRRKTPTAREQFIGACKFMLGGLLAMSRDVRRPEHNPKSEL